MQYMVILELEEVEEGFSTEYACSVLNAIGALVKLHPAFEKLDFGLPEGAKPNFNVKPITLTTSTIPSIPRGNQQSLINNDADGPDLICTPIPVSPAVSFRTDL